MLCHDFLARCQKPARPVSNGAVFDLVTVWTNSNRLPATAASAPQAALTSDTLCAEAPRLRRLVHRLLGWNASAHDIDDVVQDALLSAFAHRDSFRGDAKMTTWLTQIALSKAKNHARRARLRRKVLSLFGSGGDALPHPTDEQSGNAQRGDERLDRTRLAMQRLPHKDREVLVLRYLEQREIDQVAQLLQCSRAAIDARLSRARKKLRAELNNSAMGDDA